MEEIVRLHSRVDMGKYLEDQWRRGVFQSILLICKNGEEIAVNPLIISLLFPWLEKKVVLSKDDIILLPDYEVSGLTQKIEGVLKCKEDERKTELKVESTTEVKSHSQLPDDTPFIDFYSDDDNCSSINAALTHADSADRLDTEPGVCNVKPKSRQTEKRSAAWQFYDVVAADKASCLQCSNIISTKLGSTKGLITHIKTRHPDLFTEFINQSQKKKHQKNVDDKSIGRESNYCCAICSQNLVSGNENCKGGCPNQSCRAQFHAACIQGVSDCPACEGKHKSKYRLCTECGKSVQNMSKHQKMHRGEKPARLQCHVCEKTLCSANALKIHIETIHEGIRRYKCKFCDNNFIYASHLKRHILVVHHNYKNPKAICPDCGKQFKFISTMKRHRRVSHLGEIVRKRHFCPQCKQAFYKESLLTSHLRDQHGIAPSRRKAASSRKSLVDKTHILAEYPDLVKPEDLEFDNVS